MINVPQAYAYLLACFVHSDDPDCQDLHEALFRLSSVAGWHDRLGTVSAQVLLEGFEVLAAERCGPRRSKKQVLIRDCLRQLLADEPRVRIHSSAMLSLWADVAALAAHAATRSTGYQRDRWEATSMAWAEGMCAIRRHTNHRSRDRVHRRREIDQRPALD